MSIQDLQRITEEFESINKSYRQTFSFQARLDLLERVKRLLSTIQSLDELNIGNRNDVREGVLK